MSLRARLTVTAAVAVALAVALASLLVFFVVRNQLRGEVDDALRQRAAVISRVGVRLVQSFDGDVFPDIPAPGLGGAPGTFQVVSSRGQALRPPEGDLALAVSAHARSVAAGHSNAFFSDATVDGYHVRVLTLPLEQGYALQIARPLTEVDSVLDRVRTLLLVIAAAGIGLAAVLGLLVTRAALAPVRRLTAATEHVTETGDLGSRIEASGRDELSRLAGSFNTMLGALEESSRAQRQLVADASHELRTPLTSLRTNIEVLARDRSMADDERERLLHDVVEQLGEMTALVAELVELARGEQPDAAAEDVRLDLLVADAVERAARNHAGVHFRPDLEESLVHGVPSTIERAVSNLLDNAGKWSSPGGDVDVSVRGGEVVVRDRGPGIEQDDLPYVFDRFYRASTARGMPGSGLGLAIVRQVAEAHGGEAVVERADGGGTRVRLRLPAAQGGEPAAAAQ